MFGCGPTARGAIGRSLRVLGKTVAQVATVCKFPLLPNPKPDVVSCTYCARCVSKASGRGIVYVLWKVGWKGFDFMSLVAR